MERLWLGRATERRGWPNKKYGWQKGLGPAREGSCGCASHDGQRGRITRAKFATQTRDGAETPSHAHRHRKASRWGNQVRRQVEACQPMLCCLGCCSRISHRVCATPCPYSVSLSLYRSIGRQSVGSEAWYHWRIGRERCYRASILSRMERVNSCVVDSPPMSRVRTFLSGLVSTTTKMKMGAKPRQKEEKNKKKKEVERAQV